jgi:hypothetical protein
MKSLGNSGSINYASCAPLKVSRKRLVGRAVVAQPLQHRITAFQHVLVSLQAYRVGLVLLFEQAQALGEKRYIAFYFSSYIFTVVFHIAYAERRHDFSPDIPSEIAIILAF